MIERTPRVFATVDDEGDTPPYRTARMSIESADGSVSIEIARHIPWDLAHPLREVLQSAFATVLCSQINPETNRRFGEPRERV